ncbi:MAG: GNAT family N-acetyltransferase [Bacteroidales bacterium]|nr:GNAT family N-acetyltransferase [Bacteroidales bacterium]
MQTIRNHSENGEDAEKRKAAVRALWIEAFHDDEAYVDFFFHVFYRDHCTWTCEEDGQLLGALQAFPWDTSGTAVYVCGVSVAEDLRGRGIGSRLMQAACDSLAGSGVRRVVLVPVGPHVVPWYQRLGFVVDAAAELPPFRVSGMSDTDFTEWQRSHVMVRCLP